VYPQSKYQEFTGKKIIVDKAHNEYLQLAITAGIPALLIYLWFIGLILKNSVKSYLRNENNKYNISLSKLGEVTGEKLIINNIIELPVKELKERWKKGITSHMES
jgi:hypothetical protein